jgi:hypothetical protein
MIAEIRIKLEMAGRALFFNLAHPSENAGHADAVARLEERVARADTLARQERTGRLTVRASVVNKSDRRKAIREHLVMLGGIAEAASVGEQNVAELFRLPPANANHKTFLTAARVAVSEAVTRRALFLKYGMPETFLDELTTALDQYEAAVNDKTAGRSAHVGAAAELAVVTEEIMQVVNQLDVLNQLRFQKDGELLAAWKSARDIPWPANTKAAPPKRKGGGETVA